MISKCIYVFVFITGYSAVVADNTADSALNSASQSALNSASQPSSLTSTANQP